MNDSAAASIGIAITARPVQRHARSDTAGRRATGCAKGVDDSQERLPRLDHRNADAKHRQALLAVRDDLGE
jgi:hypothetical protein